MSKKQFCSHCKNIQKADENIDYRCHTIKTCPKLKNTLCFNCGEIGHTPKYCPKEKQLCILCQQIGHTDKDCGYQSQILTLPVSVRNPIKNPGFDMISWNTLKDDN